MKTKQFLNDNPEDTTSVMTEIKPVGNVLRITLTVAGIITTVNPSDMKSTVIFHRECYSREAQEEALKSLNTLQSVITQMTNEIRKCKLPTMEDLSLKDSDSQRD